MGLDNFWVKPGSTGSESAPMELEEAEKLNLCGGMFSPGGNGGFRGKVYAAEVEEITGVSLYTDLIDNVTVHQMAEQLESALERAELSTPDLAKMFRIYADAGADLISWY